MSYGFIDDNTNEVRGTIQEVYIDVDKTDRVGFIIDGEDFSYVACYATYKDFGYHLDVRNLLEYKGIDVVAKKRKDGHWYIKQFIVPHDRGNK